MEPDEEPPGSSGAPATSLILISLAALLVIVGFLYMTMSSK
ncbi:hypothetical protein AB0K00_19775 [Dactylosporangium sp. NPDC049525]